MKNILDIKIDRKFNFALCQFKSHNEAQIAIRELKKNTLFNRVQWARGDSDLPEEYFQTVQDLYVGHLPAGCTINELRKAIGHVIDVSQNVIKVHRSGNFGFIYFHSHAEAEHALLCLRGNFI